MGISPVAPITMGMMTTVSMFHIWRISSLRGRKAGDRPIFGRIF
ncbi:unnamed protein product [Acanthoscelides obtectus]|uniref:Uncharacterized protein n=1 Tax=Acanthoscelides obtectus TaxID=200917 RepID=A0A9P0K870_ACAOB|nr:unnamed protein product [Acanthoscelides obtectus]CAK1633462.1 hypothetical protein AOBTE_LOCUS8155 [Acanthoscelides obtectus]